MRTTATPRMDAAGHGRRPLGSCASRIPSLPSTSCCSSADGRGGALVTAGHRLVPAATTTAGDGRGGPSPPPSSFALAVRACLAHPQPVIPGFRSAPGRGQEVNPAATPIRDMADACSSQVHVSGRSVCFESLHLLLNRRANLSQRWGEIVGTDVSSFGLLQITDNKQRHLKAISTVISEHQNYL